MKWNACNNIQLTPLFESACMQGGGGLELIADILLDTELLSDAADTQTERQADHQSHRQRQPQQCDPWGFV